MACRYGGLFVVRHPVNFTLIHATIPVVTVTTSATPAVVTTVPTFPFF